MEGTSRYSPYTKLFVHSSRSVALSANGHIHVLDTTYVDSLDRAFSVSMTSLRLFVTGQALSFIRLPPQEMNSEKRLRSREPCYAQM